MNLYFISIVLLTAAFCVLSIIAEVTYIKTEERTYGIYSVENSCYNISHWIFEALLLKTALTLPILFDDKSPDQEETAEQR